MLLGIVGLTVPAPSPVDAASGDFSVAPTALSFPDTDVASTSTITVTVTNNSPTPQAPSFSGGAPFDSTNFGASQNCAGKTLGQGESCQFTYTFTPATPGSHTSNTTIGIDGDTFAISMSGIGIDPTTTTTSSTTTTSTTSTTTTTTTTPTTPTTATSPSPTGSPTPTTPSATNTPVVTIANLSGSDSGPVALGHAQVVAQGIVAFPDGAFLWETQALGNDAWPFAFGDSPPTFLVADGPGSILVSGATGPSALLATGEATFLAAGSTGSAGPAFPDTTAAATRVTFVAGSGPSAFAPGAGSRDVNVVRDVIAPGETFTLTSLFPVLVITGDGPLVDATNGDTAVVPGTAIAMSTRVQLRNDGTAPVAVIAATVGDQIA